MVTLKWNVTYEIVTPESAEHGDAEERGFVGEYGIKWPIEECTGQHTRSGGLRDLVRDCENLGVGLHEDADWLYAIDPRHDYRTGAETTYAVHPACDVSRRNLERIGRLIDRQPPFRPGR